MSKKGEQHKDWLIPNRLHVGQLKYQVRRFLKQSDDVEMTDGERRLLQEAANNLLKLASGTKLF